MHNNKPDFIENIFNSATLNDIHSAREVLAFGQDRGYAPEEIAAACVRFGVRTGSTYGKSLARKAYDLLREYKARPDRKRVPLDRLKNAAACLDDPAQLRELAAFMVGRAAALEAGIGGDPGDPDNDVNSDGNVEVE